MTNMVDYYQWLVDQVSGSEFDVDCYQQLLEKLYKVEYYAKLERDNNRLSDGLDIKDMFFDTIPYEFTDCAIGSDQDYCSVFEMLLGVAYVIEYDYLYDPSDRTRIAHWFWMMLDNLRLTEFDDDNYDQAEVERTLYIFLERLYEPDGTGNIFFTKNIYYDMRNKEISQQMNSFITEFLCGGDEEC